MRPMQISITTSVLALCLASSATANGSLDAVPLMPRAESCQLIATAQERGCEVENIFSCSIGDVPYWRVESSTADGLDWITLDEPAGQSNATGDAFGEVDIRMQTIESSAATQADLIAQGSGSASFAGLMKVWGIAKPLTAQSQIVVEGSTVISGIELVTIRSEDTAVMPPPLGAISGISYTYFDPISGIAFSGEASDPFQGPDQEMTTIGRPAEIHFDGDEGFGATTPSNDCGEFSRLVPFSVQTKDAT